jgi:hypothetical protein
VTNKGISSQWANNFIQVLAQRIREIATVELFGGNPDLAANKLALDHVVPLKCSPDDRFPVHLVARVSHLKGDVYVNQPIVAKSQFTKDQVLVGPNNWGIPIEAIAYPLVATLKMQIQRNLVNPKFLLIIQGDIIGIEPRMRRVWIH